MDHQIWNPPVNPEPGEPIAPDPSDTPKAFTGRTPGRGAAVRGGALLGAALVVAVGTAVVLGASPAPTATSGGAAPSAAATDDGAQASNAPRTARGFGRGGPFGIGGFGISPFEAGPGNGRGPSIGGGPAERLRDRFGGITVAAISDSSISLSTEDGWSRTIVVTADTKITRGGQPATLSDLHVGDAVRFAEKRNADGSFSITALAVELPRTAGTVKTVGPDSITITRRDGTDEIITTTGSTTYLVDRKAGSRSDVAVGSTIIAVGDRASDGTLTATRVEVALPTVVGTVTAVGDDTITIKRLDGTTLTVHVTSSTKIAVAGVDSAQIKDIRTGMVLIARGPQRSDGSLDASVLRAGERGKLRSPFGMPDPHSDPSATPAPSTGNG
jgi:uncharacterized protein DUF5666